MRRVLLVSAAVTSLVALIHREAYRKPADHKVTELDDHIPTIVHRATVQRDLLRLQRRVTRMLDDNGLRAWLIGGSLLGYRRFGSMLCWDDDIDLGMRSEDWSRLFALDVESSYGLVCVPEHVGLFKIYDAEAYRGNRKKAVFIDVFEYVRSNEDTWAIVSKWFKGEMFISPFPLRRTEMQGVPVDVPSRDVDAYLTRLYGEKWESEMYIRPDHSKWVLSHLYANFRSRHFRTNIYTLTPGLRRAIEKVSEDVAISARP